MIQKKSPLVSVIIPAYNAGQYIAEAINSVIRQSYQNQEIIVIDDGSNDKTKEIVYDRFGKNIIFIEQKNAGPSAARNRGIEVSKGKYIAFLDADDIWFPDKISQQVSLMEKYIDAGMVFGNTVTLKNGVRSKRSHFEKEAIDQGYFGDPVYFNNAFKKLFIKNIIMTQTVMLRSSIIRKSGMFDPDFRFGEDFLLWLNIARITKIAYQMQIVSFRRKHDSNVTNDPKKPIFNRPKLYQKIIETHGDFLNEAGVDIRTKMANAWFQLGHYKLFNQGKSNVSQYFYNSFKIKPTLRCLIYLVASVFGVCTAFIKIKHHIDRKLENN